MYMYAYIYMYTYLQSHMCIEYAHACGYTCIFIYIYIYMCIHVSVLQAEVVNIDRYTGPTPSIMNAFHGCSSCCPGRAHILGSSIYSKPPLPPRELQASARWEFRHALACGCAQYSIPLHDLGQRAELCRIPWWAPVSIAALFGRKQCVWPEMLMGPTTKGSNTQISCIYPKP